MSRNYEAEKERVSGFEWQSKYNQLELDLGQRVRNNEVTIETLKRENADLYNKTKFQNELELKIVELQNKCVLLEG